MCIRDRSESDAEAFIGHFVDELMHRNGPPLKRSTLAAVAAVSAVIYAVLTAYADRIDWVRAEPADWVAHAGLSAIGAGVILHVGIGRRRPFA